MPKSIELTEGNKLAIFRRRMRGETYSSPGVQEIKNKIQHNGTATKSRQTSRPRMTTARDDRCI